ncbi:ATP-dependent 6-phosphofructokinase [Saccharophagus sp. K07]|jgi:phosphofructokinase-like protein|uniref:6-phosphofructokinase n=1 Tax=Saccharophagus sp. K07 TaxID=2283636 RepID=UPI0016529BFE|nr:ATP-dependent 6-phosphofructokinase [Saccharophagus sp. K07]MBC6904949.1 ATP-dependent 6-phosphofructokinase [Saccharophagus sp. K07]
MRVGILTGGGDCSSLNAAIQGVTKTLIETAKAEVIGIQDGFLGLIQRRVRPLVASDCIGLIQSGGTILGTCNRSSPLNYKGQDVSDSVLEFYRELDLDCIVALGGDGTMSLCHALSQKGMNFVGIPKTIDNDLMHTDRSFGFDTAVGIVAEAMDRLHTTARSHGRVMIVETMGRYAGWIALYGGVAGGADMILLPEFPYELDEVIRVLNERAQTHHYSMLVVAEGAAPKDGQLVVAQNIADSPDPIRLGGIGHFLQKQIEPHIPMEVRTTVLGHVQRGGQPSAFDRIFASNLGCYAARLVIQKEYGRMVSVLSNSLTSVALADVANRTRTVTKDDMTLLSAIYSGVSFGVRDISKLLYEPEAAHPRLR